VKVESPETTTTAKGSSPQPPPRMGSLERRIIYNVGSGKPIKQEPVRVKKETKLSRKNYQRIERVHLESPTQARTTSLMGMYIPPQQTTTSLLGEHHTPQSTTIQSTGRTRQMEVAYRFNHGEPQLSSTKTAEKPNTGTNTTTERLGEQASKSPEEVQPHTRNEKQQLKEKFERKERTLKETRDTGKTSQNPERKQPVVPQDNIKSGSGSSLDDRKPLPIINVNWPSKLEEEYATMAEIQLREEEEQPKRKPRRRPRLSSEDAQAIADKLTRQLARLRVQQEQQQADPEEQSEGRWSTNWLQSGESTMGESPDFSQSEEP
jgi:hypothetical protein